MNPSSWSLVGAGDAIATQRLNQIANRSPDHRSLVEIVSGADVASVNLENNVFNRETFDGYPAAQSGGGYLVGVPQILDDLNAMGFNLFARGNNHALDFGFEGLRETTRHLDTRGMLHAGVGPHLADAARATYLDAAMGRVAMVSFTTTFPVSSKAGEQRSDMQGRPGVNGVTVDRQLCLSDAVARELEDVAARYGRPSLWKEANLPLVGGQAPEIAASARPRDVARIAEAIETAAAFADVVVVNAHSHEPSNPVVDVPAWFVELAHTCIDAGANVFLGHGPHQLRGVEIHADRPIFYSLGNFICHRDAGDPIPADQYSGLDLDPQTTRPHEYVGVRDSNPFLLNMTTSEWYESVLPEIRFEGDRITGITLHAIDLEHRLGPGRRGVPRLAHPDLARQIRSRLEGISAVFGTGIDHDTGEVAL